MPLFKTVHSRDHLREGDPLILCKLSWTWDAERVGVKCYGFLFAGHRAGSELRTRHTFIWDLESERCTPTTSYDQSLFSFHLSGWHVYLTDAEWEDEYAVRQVCQQLVPYCQERIIEHYWRYAGRD